MSEPDFDFHKLAYELAGSWAELDGRTSEIETALRQVWNARGATDIAKIQALDVLEHGDAYVRIVERAIKVLDR